MLRPSTAPGDAVKKAPKRKLRLNNEGRSETWVLKPGFLTRFRSETAEVVVMGVLGTG